MTGYGRGAAEGAAGRAVVEVRTVNNRFADVQVRLPAELGGAEALLRERIARAIVRGRAQVGVEWTGVRRRVAGVGLNGEVVAELLRRWEEMAALLPLPPLTAEAILRVPGVVEATREEEGDPGEAEGEADGGAAARGPEALVLAAAEAALAQLDEQRAAEGMRLREDMLARLRAVGELVGGLEARAGDAVAAARDRLRTRWEELATGTGVAVDPARLEMEMALLADRADVTEELVRLRSHLEEGARALAPDDPEPVGKRLDFLMQEFAREANTIGSKARGSDVTRLVVDLKHEIEKMREQVQNFV